MSVCRYARTNRREASHTSVTEHSSVPRNTWFRVAQPFDTNDAAETSMPKFTPVITTSTPPAVLLTSGVTDAIVAETYECGTLFDTTAVFKMRTRMFTTP